MLKFKKNNYSYLYIFFLLLVFFFNEFSTNYALGKNYNVPDVKVEESSELTRGKTVVDWLGVTDRTPNCFVMNKADDKKFFELLKNKFSNLP